MKLTQLSRIERLLKETINRFELDLSGKTVLTEAATDIYAVTAVLAASAGAQVVAMAQNSNYGSASLAIEQVEKLAHLVGVSSNINFTTSRNSEAVFATDIITNLGAVRPLDAALLSKLNSKAVISLFCEPWEVRAQDVDKAFCVKQGIPTLGTNEDASELNVFKNVGLLILKLLFEAGFEIYKNRFLLIGKDKFAHIAEQTLLQNGAQVWLSSAQKIDKTLSEIPPIDAIIVADYTTEEKIIGSLGNITAETLKEKAPHSAVIHLAGQICFGSLNKNGINCYPAYNGHARRMSKTFSWLGPQPVIELHAAGLKVGEVLHKAHLESTNLKDTLAKAIKHPFCQMWDI